MDVIQGQYQVSRKKIYGLSMRPDEKAHSPEPDLIKSPLSPAEVSFQLDRFRTLVREKDEEIVKLRHELILLKQIERRQQKDIESFQTEFDEAPRLIKSLQAEMSQTKKKLKQYFTRIEKDSKQIKTLDEDRRKLREQNEKLEKLNSEKSLLERSLLVKKLDEARLKAQEAESKLVEEKKKYDFASRNLENDNRQLRGKINSMEKEILILRDRTVTLDDVIKEKDKTIASLSIYRYNAIHRKVESICKKCLKREKAEAEIKRKSAILGNSVNLNQEKLPKIAPPIMTLASSTSVNVSVSIPLKSKSETVEYSRLALIYSNDPSMQENHKVLIDIEEPSNQSWKSTIKSASGDKDGTIDKENNSEKDLEERTISRKVKITNLESGKFYFFQLVPGFQDVDGSPTEPESIFVDGLPQPPPKPVSIVNSDNVSITVLSELGAATGSAITSYRLYHSNDPSMTPSFLVDQILVSDMQLEDGKIKFTFSNPELRLSHYFHVTAVNIMGESMPSEVSDKSVIDFAPNQPSKPNIKKLSTTSIQISSDIRTNGGSDVDYFMISVFKTEPEKSEQLKIKSNNILFGTNLEQIIEELEMDTCYQFQLVAHNVVGQSIPSDLSDIVRLDALLPIADAPIIEIQSPTSVKIVFPDISMIQKPAIKSFRVSWSTIEDIGGNMANTITFPSSQNFCIIDNLPECQSLFFGNCYVGETSEGLFSTPTLVHLASAIPLPMSTSSTPRIGGSPLPPVSRSLSSLSLEQKSKNMHDGVPAHFQSADSLNWSQKNLPVEIPNSADSRRRSRGSIEFNRIKNTSKSSPSPSSTPKRGVLPPKHRQKLFQ